MDAGAGVSERDQGSGYCPLCTTQKSFYISEAGNASSRAFLAVEPLSSFSELLIPTPLGYCCTANGSHLPRSALLTQCFNTLPLLALPNYHFRLGCPGLILKKLAGPLELAWPRRFSGWRSSEPQSQVLQWC